MIWKVFILMYQTMNFMKIILGAPTVDSTIKIITTTEPSVAENVIARILTHPNISNLAQPLSAFGEDADAFYDSHDIIFPDRFRLLSKPNLGIQTAPDCTTKDAHFCEEYETYPYGFLNNVLERTKKHNEFFGTDEAAVEIANRFADSEEETFICAATVKTIFPKVGKNKDDNWKYIINQGDEDGLHVQGIRIETCAKLNGPCNLLTDSPFGYVASCKQKFVLRRLLSVADNGQPVPDTFQIPSACCCSIKRDVRFLTESGRSSVSSKKRRRK